MQSTIEGIKAISRVELYVSDIDGKLVASTKNNGNSFENSVLEFVRSAADSQEIQGCQFFKIYDDQQLEYILIASDAGDNAYMVGKLAAFQLQNLMVAYKERFDKDNFVKNLLLDNLLLVDIYSRSKKLHIQTDVKRVVLIVEAPNGKDVSILEKVRENFGQNGRDFVTAVDENNVIVVKEVAENETNKEIDKYARSIEDSLIKDGIKEVRIAYGTSVKEIKEVSRSYKRLRWLLMSERFSLTRGILLHTASLE
jgi:carbohydrate diacid regulator